uniref:PPM-type phosphatase domain-containing protein n=1 Tax=Haptolina brevifila TaxID=156173 RepID=A0A7S2GIY5_9EUKA
MQLRCVADFKLEQWLKNNTTVKHKEYETKSRPGSKPCVLRCAAASMRGNYPEKEEGYGNQDSYTVEEIEEGVLAGVFDGHGEYGDDCAEFVRDEIGDVLSDKHKEFVDWSDALSETYQTLNKKSHKEKDFDDLLSGTTAVTAYFGEGAIWFANVGDSRAVLGKVDQGGSFSTTPLFVDQTPFRQDERERVRAAGAQVMSYGQRMKGAKEPDSQYWEERADAMGADADAGTYKLVGGEPRVWAPGKEMPGTAFTRSIGDKYGEKVGVIGEPEVLRYELKEGDRFVFMCSDGVHDFITSQRVLNMIIEAGALNPDAPPETALAACRAVVAEAYRLWMTHDIRSDDITIVLVIIDPQ